jgi:hypothetical protein
VWALGIEVFLIIHGLAVCGNARRTGSAPGRGGERSRSPSR